MRSLSEDIRPEGEGFEPSRTAKGVWSGGDSAGLGATLPSLPLRRDLYPPAPGVPLPVGPASSGECSQRGGTASARARGRRVSYRVGFGVLDRYRRGRKGGSGARVSGLSSTRGGFGLQ